MWITLVGFFIGLVLGFLMGIGFGLDAGPALLIGVALGGDWAWWLSRFTE